MRPYFSDDGFQLEVVAIPEESVPTDNTATNALSSLTPSQRIVNQTADKSSQNVENSEGSNVNNLSVNELETVHILPETFATVETSAILTSRRKSKTQNIAIHTTAVIYKVPNSASTKDSLDTVHYSKPITSTIVPYQKSQMYSNGQGQITSTSTMISSQNTSNSYSINTTKLNHTTSQISVQTVTDINSDQITQIVPNDIQLKEVSNNSDTKLVNNTFDVKSELDEWKWEEKEMNKKQHWQQADNLKSTGSDPEILRTKSSPKQFSHAFLILFSLLLHFRYFC
ncbi:unnamed protein product [Thelazia callipaeda]|uniref:Uncharacterized protein n=1 Tax=Thelazia callipaeda TaxID=103827 RepID=A0A0N5DC26_THECL|nr:unnamed protein product [Thelazia callipaeda]